MTAILRQAQPEIDERAFQILEGEVRALIQGELESGAMNEISSPICHKHLSVGHPGHGGFLPH